MNETANENTITVNGIDYKVLFMYRTRQDSLMMLLEQGEDIYCVRYEEQGGKVELFPASDEQIEETTQAYNAQLLNMIEYQGTIYEIAAEVSGITLACKSNDPSVLYPFKMEDGQWKPLELDAAGKMFYKNMYRARLEENHEFLMEAQPVISSARNALPQARITSFEDYGVYLYHEKDGKPGVLFINELTGKVVVSPSEQQALLQRFKDWEQKEYDTSRSFTIENVEEN